MQKVILYPHSGCENHGCEALVRSTAKILGNNINLILVSKNPEQDSKYGIDKLCSIVKQNVAPKSFIKRILTALKYKLGDKLAYERQTYHDVLRYVDNDTVCLSFGGDNYCYGKPVYIYNMNKLFREKGAKTFLWGCSIEPKNIDNEMLEDLKGYDGIFARETLTQKALVERGMNNVMLYTDPAFVLDKKVPRTIPKEFMPGNTVGINISPMVMDYSKNRSLTFANYRHLIDTILHETDMNIALIPHVVWNDNDDRLPLSRLYDEYKECGRICMIEDTDCESIKGLISQCRFIVTARTHASIAAYSTGVPTLVLGYSIKARGIAQDLFGTDDNFVVPVQYLSRENDLTDGFMFIVRNESQIRETLKSKRTEMAQKAMNMKAALC